MTITELGFIMVSKNNTHKKRLGRRLCCDKGYKEDNKNINADLPRVTEIMEYP